MRRYMSRDRAHGTPCATGGPHTSSDTRVCRAPSGTRGTTHRGCVLSRKEASPLIDGGVRGETRLQTCRSLFSLPIVQVIFLRGVCV